jgi:Tfp pilus assembly protein PilE
MNSSHVFDWIEYTLAMIQLIVLFGIIGVMALLVYKDYKKFDDKNYYK